MAGKTSTEGAPVEIDRFDIDGYLPKKPLVHGALVITIVVIASPVVFAFLISTQNISEVYRVTYLGIGSEGFSKYATVLGEYNFAQYMWNSFVMSTIVMVGEVLISLFAALALVYYRFPFKRVAFFLILFTLLFPVPVRIVPLFELMVKLGWTNTMLGLTLPFIASPTAVFLFRQHFQSIPASMAENAKLDGVGPLTFLFRVVVPMSKGMITGMGVISFIGTWNAYLWPLIIVNNQEKQVVQVGLRFLQAATQSGQTDWALIMAGAMISLLPPLLVLIALHRPLLKTFGLQMK